MLPIVGAAMALAEFVPGIVGWIKGDKAQERAEKIVSVAKAVAGVDDPDQAVAAIKADPALAVQFQQRMAEIELEFYREDTKRLASVNETMRAELAAEDKFRGRWRPYWGYVTGTAFGLQILGMLFLGGWAVIAKPEKAVDIINAVAALATALTTTWGIALAVLGVAVWKRSTDKKTSAEAGSQAGNLEGLLDSVLARARGERP